MHFTLRKNQPAAKISVKNDSVRSLLAAWEETNVCREFYEVFWCHFLFAVRGLQGLPWDTLRPQFVSLSAYGGDPRLLPKAFNPRFVRKRQLSLTKTVWTQEKLAWIKYVDLQLVKSAIYTLDLVPSVFVRLWIFCCFASMRLFVHLLVTISEVVHFLDENLNYWLLN